jgi:hypothetical protein
MAQAAFVLPSGVELTLDGGDLSVRHSGDIIIEGTPTQGLGDLVSTAGDIVLMPDKAVQLSSITAAGTVRLSGKVSATSITGKRIEFEAGTLKVEVLNASESIQLSGKKLEAQVVVAPQVDISSSLKGRATAIECGNELGAHKLKGGFSLAEYVELMPGGADLLKKHGIEVPESDDDDDDDDDDDEDDEAPGGDEDARDAGADDSGEELVAVADDEGSVAIPEEIQSEIEESYLRIMDAYGDADPPPPVQLVGKMVEAEDLGDLKLQINAIWADLIKFHAINKGRRMPNKLGPLFEGMQLALRRIPS